MSIFQRFYSALPALGLAVTVLAAIFGVFAYFVSVDTKTSLAWVLVAAGVPLSLCVMLGDMLHLALSDTDVHLPRILRCLSVQRAQASPQLLLIEQSRLFGQGMSASVYSMEDGFEVLVAEGYVLTIQQDELIQIAVTGFIDGTEAIWEQLTANSPDALKRTLVRPGNQRLRM